MILPLLLPSSSSPSFVLHHPAIRSVFSRYLHHEGIRSELSLPVSFAAPANTPCTWAPRAPRDLSHDPSLVSRDTLSCRSCLRSYTYHVICIISPELLSWYFSVRTSESIFYIWFPRNMYMRHTRSDRHLAESWASLFLVLHYYMPFFFVPLTWATYFGHN